MIATIQPSVIRGELRAPASKSSMQRACAAALVQPGTTILKNPGKSNDDIAALDVIEKLGATIISLDNGELQIISEGIQPLSDQLHCGESGLGVRMFTPVAALSGSAITITGSGSLLNRPMHFFDEIFPALGIKISTNKGRLPFNIKGPLRPANIEIDGSLSSQFLTGLLMAYAGAGASDVSIKVNNLKSRPYIDLTLQVMRAFGLPLPENKNYQEFYFKPNPHHARNLNKSHSEDANPRRSQRMDESNPDNQQDSNPERSRRMDESQPDTLQTASLERPSAPLRTEKTDPTPSTTYTIEGDWSGAAFLLVAGAIAGEIKVHGIHNTSTQADKKIVDALLDAGAEVTVTDDSVHVKRNKLEPFIFDATDCPDLFPPLVALAAHCKGITQIRGLKRLKHKESDRGVTLREEFDKLSTRIDLNEDVMVVYGNGGVFVKNHVLNSHHDHRIAMACAVTCLPADFYVQIRNAEAVDKSYPDFFIHLKNLGANLSLQDSSSNAVKKNDPL